MAERYIIREKFWAQLLAKAKEKTKLHAGISPSQHGWIGTGAGRRGLAFNYVVRQHDANVELYIDRGDESDAENKRIFDDLAKSKKEIESAFGSILEWQRLDGKRACRIKKQIEVGGYRDDAPRWSAVHDAPGADQQVDGLADRDSAPAQRAEMAGRRYCNHIPAHRHDFEAAQ